MKRVGGGNKVWEMGRARTDIVCGCGTLSYEAVFQI